MEGNLYSLPCLLYMMNIVELLAEMHSTPKSTSVMFHKSTYIWQELLGHLPMDRIQGLLAKQILQSLNGLPALHGAHIPNKLLRQKVFRHFVL